MSCPAHLCGAVGHFSNLVCLPCSEAVPKMGAEGGPTRKELGNMVFKAYKLVLEREFDLCHPGKRQKEDPAAARWRQLAKQRGKERIQDWMWPKVAEQSEKSLVTPKGKGRSPKVPNSGEGRSTDSRETLGRGTKRKYVKKDASYWEHRAKGYGKVPKSDNESLEGSLPLAPPIHQIAQQAAKVESEVSSRLTSQNALLQSQVEELRCELDFFKQKYDRVVNSRKGWQQTAKMIYTTLHHAQERAGEPLLDYSAHMEDDTNEVFASPSKATK